MEIVSKSAGCGPSSPSKGCKQGVLTQKDCLHLTIEQQLCQHSVLLALDLHRPHEVALCCCTGTMAHSTPIQKHTRKTIVTKCFEIIFTARTERCAGDKNQLFCQPCQMFLTTSGTKQCSELCLWIVTIQHHASACGENCFNLFYVKRDRHTYTYKAQTHTI